jgi:hypothetical protein
VFNGSPAKQQLPLKEMKTARSGELTVDRYGFTTEATAHRSIEYWRTIESATQRKKRMRIENGRVHKWQEMLHPEKFKIYRDSRKLKTRAWKGIPNAMRQQAWFQLAGASVLKQCQPKLYDTLQHESENEDMWSDKILLDIDRTFPNHVMFRDIGGTGQRQLFRILRAYSIHDREVGYCQGIGFIAAFLLTYMEEENVFWMLVAILRGDKFQLYGMYIDGMPKVLLNMATFDRLLAETNPKLANHFESLMVQSPMYTTDWFMTLFTSTFPFDYVVRIWDVYLSEGDAKIIYRVSLALLRCVQHNLLSLDFENTLKTLQDLPTSLSGVLLISPEAFMRQVEAVRITTQQVRDIEATFK